jgi:prokaryotic ubiquitin-like protein Pup
MYRKYFPYRVHDSLRKRGEIQLVHTASEQEQEAKQVDKSKTSPPPTTETAHRKTKVAEKGEKIKKDLDKIIDEIDDVLEENAEEFIRSYVQRGGE